MLSCASKDVKILPDSQVILDSNDLPCLPDGFIAISIVKYEAMVDREIACKVYLQHIFQDELDKN